MERMTSDRMDMGIRVTASGGHAISMEEIWEKA
jgi:hypothetical protein